MFRLVAKFRYNEGVERNDLHGVSLCGSRTQAYINNYFNSVLRFYKLQ